MKQMNSCDESVHNDSENCKAIAKKKSKKPKFHTPEKQNRTLVGVKLEGEFVEFGQQTKPIMTCRKIGIKTKGVYGYMGTFNPCLLSFKKIADDMAINQAIAKECVEELQARHIIRLVKKGSGRALSHWEFEMQPSKWDLSSKTSELIEKSKRFFKEIDLCSDARSEKNQLCSDTRSEVFVESNLCSDTRSEKNQLCSDRLSEQKNSFSDTRSEQNSPYIERYLNQIDLDISLCEERNGLGLLDGQAIQRELPLKRLIKGELNSQRAKIKNARDARFVIGE